LTEVASMGLTGVPAAAERLQGAIRLASRGLVERDVLVELIALSAVAEEHLLVIGEPGTAKSEAVRRVARALGGRYFEYLLGRFTELLGVDLDELDLPEPEGRRAPVSKPCPVAGLWLRPSL